MSPSIDCTPLFLLADNRLLREALTRVLAKKTDLEIVGSAPFNGTTVETLADLSPRVLLFDPPEIRSGLIFLRSMREALPHLRTIMIGMETNSELLLQAVRAGISGYMLMDASAAEIVAAVRFVINGGAVCPPELCQTLFDEVAAERTCLEIQDQIGITRREQQLVDLIERGLTNKEIASALNLSEQTVKNHIHRMSRKVGARNRLEVVSTIRSHGALIA
jgi:DNA-binding NarL/FixJ family response regulator